jgi:hypothetical protein
MFIGSGSERRFSQKPKLKSMRLGMGNPQRETDSSSWQFQISMLLRNKRLCFNSSSTINIDFRFLQLIICRVLRTGREHKVNDIIELQLEYMNKSSSDL